MSYTGEEFRYCPICQVKTWHTDNICDGSHSHPAKLQNIMQPSGKKLVHIEELFQAFQTFQQAIMHATSLFRQPQAQENAMQDARRNFRNFCEQNGLEIDWEDRR